MAHDPETAAALRDELDKLPEEIARLKAKLIQDSTIDPATVMKEIEEKETRLKVVSTLAVHAEADRLRAEIAAAGSPIEGYERDLEEATNAQQRADEARIQAHSNYEAAAARVHKIRHDIETARRAVQSREIELSRHLSQAKASLAA